MAYFFSGSIKHIKILPSYYEKTEHPRHLFILEGTIYCNMEEKPEIQDKELYKKLSPGYLIKCAENKNIDEWNDLYEGYFASGWNKLHPDKEWKPENIVELQSQQGIILLGYDGIDFREAIRRRVSFKRVHLEGTHFWGARLMGADFREAHLEGADFRWAHLEGAMFNEAHLNGAKFKEAHLKGAQFCKAHLEGATFEYAILDGETLFTKNTIDDKTDFTGTGLSAARIDPSLRAKLERNIREIHWKVWYEKPKFYPDLENISKKLWRIGCMIWHFIKYPPQKKIRA